MAIATGAVVGIGWYEHGADGLLNLHQIGIWPGVPLDDMTFLRGDMVPAGTDAPLDGLYRVITFQVPLTLEAGRYSVAGACSVQVMTRQSSCSGKTQTRFLLILKSESAPR